MRAAVLGALLSCLALPAAGCGYSAGQAAGGGKSIAVPLFTNTTFRRDLERDLTRAVHQELRTRSGYALRSEPADLVLTGKVVEIAEGVLSEYEGAEIRESSVRIVAEITVTDSRTGEKIVDRLRVAERRSFAPVKGESVRSAESAAIRGLAERIVSTLEAGW
ncbi:MAG: LPS assembly lipoprotein LptE [Planctomycetes bacterium]|jgi:outer membrane lipopolysaccharide assembly protein LptE/RlpB|nr:LPS assembly lipoprotein LptE [Planctomycetota bacterium]